MCTTPEVLACYSASLVALATHGDNGAWARFTIITSLQLRARLGDSSRMLVLTVYFSMSGVGEWLDNDGRDNLPSSRKGALTLNSSLPSSSELLCQCTSCSNSRRRRTPIDVVYGPSTHSGDKSVATRRMKRETVVGASWLSWSEPGFMVNRQTASYDSMITEQKGGWLATITASERTELI